MIIFLEVTMKHILLLLLPLATFAMREEDLDPDLAHALHLSRLEDALRKEEESQSALDVELIQAITASEESYMQTLKKMHEVQLREKRAREENDAKLARALHLALNGDVEALSATIVRGPLKKSDPKPAELKPLVERKKLIDSAPGDSIELKEEKTEKATTSLKTDECGICCDTKDTIMHTPCCKAELCLDCWKKAITSEECKVKEEVLIDGAHAVHVDGKRIYGGKCPFCNAIPK